ncbi:MAG: inositol monophosphatase family protein [Thermodesulfobacteriota bacterium]
MADLRDIAIKAAKKAGQYLKKNVDKVKHIEFKGEIDVVTEMDKGSEELIVNILRDGLPESGVLTEERTEIPASIPYRWIVDPLDGTTNYAHSYPVFCVSIALEKEGRIILGVVYDPNLDEIFIAEKGKGATLNDRKIKVSTTSTLSEGLLATGFPYDIRTSKENNIGHFNRFALKVQAIRRAGAAALDLCNVACGRFDGFWELKLRPWDVAAGGLIVKEAGGKLSDFQGNPFSINSRQTLATNGNLHHAMIDVLQKV